MLRPGAVRNLLIAYAVLVLLAAAPAGGKPPRGGVLKTFYAAIHYPDGATLRGFGERITKTLVKRDRTRAETDIASDVDDIVYRVRTLLAMYPSNFRFTVNLHATPEGLARSYREAGETGIPPIAFYVHRSRTIHVGLKGLDGGVLAHEIAHAVISAYFDTPPPSRVQEILARYVDKHLWDENN